MDKKVNIALVGYGYWGKILEKYLQESPYFNLKTIYYPSAPITGIFTNRISDLLGDQSVRHAIVAAPNGTHYALCKTFLETGFSLMCEKPLSKRYREAIELERIAEKNSVFLETNYLFTDSPTIREMKNLLGKIGTVQALELRMGQWGNFYEKDDVFEVLAVHMIAIALFLLQRDAEQIRFEKWVQREDGVCDVGQVSFMLGETRVSLQVSSQSIKKSRAIIAFGSKGTIEADLMDEKKTLALRLCKEKQAEIYSFDEKNNIAGALERFYQVITFKKDPNTQLSLAVNKVLEGKYA